MNVERRKFMKGSLFLMMFGSLFSFAGCTIGSVYAQIEAYVPVALQAISGLLVFIPGGAAADPILVLVKAGFADLAATVKQYQSAAAADKATILGKISTIISSIIANFTTFMGSLSVPSGVTTTVQGIAALILSTLSGFAAAIAPATSLPAAAAHSVQINKSQVTYTPKKRSVSDFKKEFNALVQAQHPEVQLH